MYDFLRSERDLQVVNLKFQTDVENLKFWFLYKKYNGVKDSNVHLFRLNSADASRINNNIFENSISKKGKELKKCENTDPAKKGYWRDFTPRLLDKILVRMNLFHEQKFSNTD